MVDFDFQELAKKWPSAFVARRSIEDFTGGLITPGTLRNLDSLGLGPERLIIGKRVVYPVASLIGWLQNRREG